MYNIIMLYDCHLKTFSPQESLLEFGGVAHQRDEMDCPEESSKCSTAACDGFTELMTEEDGVKTESFESRGE